MKKRNKQQKVRTRPFVLKLFDVLYEDAKRRKAIRVLEKQAWGLEFLSLALVKAGRYMGEGISLFITDKNGVRMELRYDDARRSDAVKDLDDSILMHLDDDAAIERFIRHNARR